jgi:hypothetical protein
MADKSVGRADPGAPTATWIKPALSEPMYYDRKKYQLIPVITKVLRIIFI